MNQYPILSTTTVFLADSSTMHYNNQGGVLTIIIKTFLNTTVSSNRHWDTACTTLAIWTLFLLGDSDCSIRRWGFSGTVSNPHSKRQSIHKQRAHHLLTSCEACFILSTIPSWPRYCKESHSGSARSFSTAWLDVSPAAKDYGGKPKNKLLLTSLQLFHFCQLMGCVTA